MPAFCYAMRKCSSGSWAWRGHLRGGLHRIPG
jgi:hypothetical protein